MSIALSSLANHPSYPVRLFADDVASMKKQDQCAGTDLDPRENFVQTTGVETYAAGKPTFTTQFILGESDGRLSLKSRCLKENGEVSWVRIRELSGQDEKAVLQQESVSAGPSADRSFRSDGTTMVRLADPATRLQELNELFSQEWNIAH